MGKGLDFLNSLPEWNGSGGFALDNISKVLAFLDNPQDKVHSVHVAGTNGKGSVSAAIAAILGASGATAGLTISPHLESMNERVVINGKPVADDLLDSAAAAVLEASIHEKQDVSFFEAITACAFWIFSELKLDWAVLETGLGGRLDATNVVKRPEACVIVTIDYDHENLLGSSLAQIAAEKAGIIKAGSILVTGELIPESFEKINDMANALRVPHSNLGRDYWVDGLGSNGENYGRFRSVNRGESFEFCTPLKGEHQLRNAAVAINTLRSLGLSIASCVDGVRQVYWPARLEELSLAGRPLILDCAHNPAGIKQAIRYVSGKYGEKFAVVFGVFADKRWKEMIDLIKPYASSWRILAPESIRALPTQRLAEYLSSNGVKFVDHGTNYHTLVQVLSSEPDRSPVLICGSIYLLGSVRSVLRLGSKPLWTQKEAFGAA